MAKVEKLVQPASERSTTERRRRISGLVISDKMQKTIVVEASFQTKHPKYGKYFKKYKTYKAHDEKEESGVGDRVEIIESRPISKQKRFRLVKVLERAKSTHEEIPSEI